MGIGADPVTARRASLVACHACGRLSPLHEVHCPRCGGHLYLRKPDSVQRTWALLIGGVILYLPANLLPVMRVVSMGQEQSDTIISGVVYFVRTGSWHLALIIFIASVLVPVLKLTILSSLLLSVRRRSKRRPVTRTRLYRITEFIGRWSMVDIFVVTLMVAMVELGNVATIEPGPGAFAFALVVITTMLAAHSFDPRLIWDSIEETHG